MKPRTQIRKLATWVLTASLLHFILGDVFTGHLIFAMFDHSHQTEAAFTPTGIQLKLVHNHFESESVEAKTEPHPDHEIHLPNLDSHFRMATASGGIPYAALFQILSLQSPFIKAHSSSAFSIRRVHWPTQLHNQIRSIVILV